MNNHAIVFFLYLCFTEYYKKYRYFRHYYLQAKFSPIRILSNNPPKTTTRVLIFNSHLAKENILLQVWCLKNTFSLFAPVFPLALTIFWVTGMIMTGTEAEEGGRTDCWDDYSDSSTIYIIVTPMILALTVTSTAGYRVTN